MSTPRRISTADLVAQGEDALELLVKAAGNYASAAPKDDNDENDLESDFQALDQARAEGDSAAASQEDDGQAPKGGDDAEGDGGDDGQDAAGATADGGADRGMGGDDEDEDPKPFAKAEPGTRGGTDAGEAEDGFVDAAPILMALDARLAASAEELALVKAENAGLREDLVNIKALIEEQLGLSRALLPVVKAQQAALASFAGNAALLADTPVIAKAQGGQRPAVTVPTARPKTSLPDAATLFAKADAYITDSVLSGILEHHKNRNDSEALLAALPRDVREKVLGPSA